MYQLSTDSNKHNKIYSNLDCGNTDSYKYQQEMIVCQSIEYDSEEL